MWKNVCCREAGLELGFLCARYLNQRTERKKERKKEQRTASGPGTSCDYESAAAARRERAGWQQYWSVNFASPLGYRLMHGSCLPY